MGAQGWVSDPIREAKKSPGEKQALHTELMKGGSESQSKPIKKKIPEAGEW